MTAINALTSSTDPTATDGSAANGGSGQSSAATGVSQNEFLTLLVAQLKNQDPMAPTNSDQFMGELAQFSQLQETVGVHQDLNSLLTANGITVPQS